MKILVINAGSSSLKYQLIDAEKETAIAKGLVERIGQEMSVVKYEYFTNGEKQKVTQELPIPSQQEAFQKVAELLTDPQIGVIKDVSEIKHIGHRVVHGGEKFTSTQKISAEMMQELRDLIPLAPLHNPGNIIAIEAAEKIFTKAENYAIFDTAFHQTLPEMAYRYAIPNQLYTEDAVRVYGFHGTSHKYVDSEIRKYFSAKNLKNIVIHLGNGASITAIDQNGKSIDTSMGFGPNEGLVMGTRSGDIDSSVIFYLLEKYLEGGSVSEKNISKIKNILNKESGMLGITGFSDSRDVTELYLKNDANAVLCMEMYAYRIKKYIGSYIAALNGVDIIAFTAGIGENSAEVRELVCQNLECFGIKLDSKKNVDLNHASKIEEIQDANSKVKILIVPTNEELQIAREVVELQ